LVKLNILDDIGESEKLDLVKPMDLMKAKKEGIWKVESKIDHG
jgi:hypothetical protein